MQVASKVSLLPKQRAPAARSPSEPRARFLPDNRKEPTMTGVLFLLAVSALLGGSLVLSRDA